MQLTKEQIQIEEKFMSLLVNEPLMMINVFLVLMGKEAVKANATELKLSQESNIGEFRYKINTKINIKKIGKRKENENN